MTDEEIRRMLLANYAKCEQSLAHYFKNAWRVLEPQTKLAWNWHIEYIAEHLEAVEAGQIKRLFINMPPRNVKSNLVTVTYPTWVWGPKRRAHRKFMAASYSSSLSMKHSVDRRTIIESPWYQAGWSTCFEMSPDQNVKTEFTNDRRGHMIATSMTGTATGKGCNVLLIDDPVNPKEANSETERESVNRDYDTTFTSRLDDKENDAIIIVMQRLHTKDLVGHIKAKKQDGWVDCCLPAEQPEPKTYYFPMTGRFKERAAGDLLHAEREGPRVLAEMRTNLGTAGFEAQYNQRPTLAEGNMVKRKWWKFYDPRNPPKFDAMIQAWDFAVKAKTINDCTVGTVWGRVGAAKYLVDIFKDRVEFPGQQKALLEMSRKWPKAGRRYYEDKANGPSVAQSLKKVVPGLIAVEPEGDKVARVSSILPTLEAGDVYLPDPGIPGYDWVNDWLDEWSAFPDPSWHDDQVDSGTYAIQMLAKNLPMQMPVAGHGSGVTY